MLEIGFLICPEWFSIKHRCEEQWVELDSESQTRIALLVPGLIPIDFVVDSLDAKDTVAPNMKLRVPREHTLVMNAIFRVSFEKILVERHEDDLVIREEIAHEIHFSCDVVDRKESVLVVIKGYL
jgi:hypothetical protein